MSSAQDETVKTTFHGLHDWFKHAFEHYGWMVLAINDDQPKIELYKESLKKLDKQLTAKIDSTDNQDKKKDLKILQGKLAELIKHSEKCLVKANTTEPEKTPKDQEGGAKKKRKSKSKGKSKSKSKSKSKGKMSRVKKTKTKSKSKSKGKNKTKKH